MKPFIHPSFWSDPEIEQQPPEIKLCALWLITNSKTSVLGICEASPRRFAFETGLDASVLARVCQLLPGTFSQHGQSIFIRNFIRFQFGTGDALTRNNYFKILVRDYKNVRDESLRHAILAEYQEFGHAEEGVQKPLATPPPSPPQGVQNPEEGQGKERTGQEEGSAEGRNQNSAQVTIEEVKAWAVAYPTLPKPDDGFCEWWWEEQEKRGWTDPQTGRLWHKPKAAFAAAWKGAVHRRHEREAMHGSRPPLGSSAPPRLPTSKERNGTPQ